MEMEFLEKILKIELRQAFINWYHGNKIDIKFNSVDRYYDYLFNYSILKKGFSDIGNKMLKMYIVLFEPETTK
jgi:hypothetical protein